MNIIKYLKALFHSCSNNYETIESFTGKLKSQTEGWSLNCIMRKRKCSVCGSIICEAVAAEEIIPLDVEWFDTFKLKR